MTVPAKSKAEFLELIKRHLAEYHVLGWVGRGGEEIFSSIAAVAAKISERMAQRYDALYILRATSGSRAAGTITVTWTEGTTEAHTLLAGQVVCGTRWGVEYRLTEDLEVGASAAADTAVTVGVEAVRMDFESNVAAVHVDQWALPAGVNRKEHISWSEATTDSARDEFLAGLDAGEITVAGATDMEGGALATLPLIGAGRGKPKAPGEPDATYRERIRKKPDRISPAGILRAVNAVLKPYGVEATIVEPWTCSFTFGDEEHGEIGGEFGFDRLRHFHVVVPDLGTSVTGFTIGDEEFGEIGHSRCPIGEGDVECEGVIDGLQGLLDRISAGGVWASVSKE